MEKRWILRDTDTSLVAALARDLKLSPLLARILVQRGFTETGAAQSFLSSTLRSDLPSPFLLAGMETAVERLVRAVENHERVCVWGDYDVDGTTGTAVLVSFLKEIGLSPIFYIPHRIDEGYGLSRQGIDALKARGVSLIISVDCGIANVEEIAWAQSVGIDCIVVDHHELPEKLPAQAVAVINPHRPDCRFPDKGLCGAGLAFYLVMGLRARLREEQYFASTEVPDIRRHLDIVALGTIADMVPLRGANRVLTRRGLLELSGSSRPGVMALRQVAGVRPGDLDAGTVAFQLGPRINAAGRMDAARKVVEMLTTDSLELAQKIAEELDTHNRERREAEAKVLAEALEEIERESLHERRSIVVGRRGWHPGVLGIVASRIVERFHRPTVVVGLDGDESRGSGRSIRGFHMVEGLNSCADLLEKYGGHQYAGGLSVREKNLSSFAERFEEVAQATLTEEDLRPFIEVDVAVQFPEISLEVARQISALGPFGIGNPEPVFQTCDVEVSERRDFRGGARFRLKHRGLFVNAVAFGTAAEFPGKVRDKLDVVYRLKENEWQGTYALELRLLDVKQPGREG